MTARTTSLRRLATLSAAALLLLCAAAAAPGAAPVSEETVSGLIVKPRARARAGLVRSLESLDASGLSKAANAPLKMSRRMSGNGYVVKLERPMPLSEARIITQRLMRNDGDVEFAEPDRIVHPVETTPTDPDYLVHQWHYFAPGGSYSGAVNLPDAWDITKGGASITVAVIDTGYRPHVDLGTVLPGYDFLTSTFMANDGDGRDNDARDPGDWTVADDCGVGSGGRYSSWHGTHVAGTIAALMNNGLGGTGIAPGVRILPVRGLGKCGGPISDIADGMRWAAGLSVPGVPDNPNPAHVMNLSLGAVGTCSSTFQDAVTDVVNAGKIIVAASGNNADVYVNMPANCSGVLAVTAHTADGDLAGYANVGAETAISAPGGYGAYGVWSLNNTGTTVPETDSYGTKNGTSMATPHVTGVVALMLSLKPTLTPAEVRSYLQASARDFPAGSLCATTYAGLCGSGLLDALEALLAIPAAAPTVTLEAPYQVVAPNTTVTLAGGATAVAPRVIASYRWTRTSGGPVGLLGNDDTAVATFTPTTAGTRTFTLEATDTTRRTGTAIATVVVQAPEPDPPDDGDGNAGGGDDTGGDGVNGSGDAGGGGGGGGCAMTGTAGGGISDFLGAFGALALLLAGLGARRAVSRRRGKSSRTDR